ncbi:hypothetical protein BJX70DRAFT_396546 [Aspergillus crustosus]
MAPAKAYLAHTKIFRGRTSCARRYHGSTKGLFTSKGHWVAWHAANSIFYQDLRFAVDGSLQQVRKLATDFPVAEIRNLAVNANGVLFVEMLDPGFGENQMVYVSPSLHFLCFYVVSTRTKLCALGEDGVYMTGRIPNGGGRCLLAYDIQTGNMTFRVPFMHIPPPHHPATTIRDRTGAELLIEFHLQGVPGGQTFVDADAENPGEFALVTTDEDTNLQQTWVKIHKFGQDATSLAFVERSVEILYMGPGEHQISGVAVHPYRNIGACFERDRAIPILFELHPDPDQITARNVAPVGIEERVDRWLVDGPATEISLPPMRRTHKNRWGYVPGPLDVGADYSRLEFGDGNRLLQSMFPRHFFCLFDFVLRSTHGVVGRANPNPATLEIF